MVLGGVGGDVQPRGLGGKAPRGLYSISICTRAASRGLTCLQPRAYLPTALPLYPNRRGVCVTAGTAPPAASPHRCPGPPTVGSNSTGFPVCRILLAGAFCILGLSIGPQWLVREAPLVCVKGAFHPPGVVGHDFRRGAGPSTRRPAPLPQSRSRARSLSLSLLSSRPRVVAVTGGAWVLKDVLPPFAAFAALAIW